MASAIVLTRAELLERRQRLLDKAGMPYDELYDLAQRWLLRPNERDCYEGIRTCDFLLGAD